MVRFFLYCFLVILIQGSLPANAQTTVAVQYLLSTLNQARASRGIAPVRLDAALTRAATAHAIQMANHGTISHRFSGEQELSARGFEAGAHFDRITENVAEGPSALSLQDAWMHSDAHRANILDPNVDAVGIGIILRDDRLYAVQDFQRTVPILTLEQQEAAIGVLLDRAGLELRPGTDARETCAMDSGYAGEEQPRFVMRYTTGDLTILPSQLQTHLSKSKERQVSVGACTPTRKGDFSVYRIAIVLYP